MKTPIINLDAIDFVDLAHGERFQARIGDLSQRLGAQKLGYNLTEIAPGKYAFPRHCHRVNEEMFFVVEGTGELRIGDEIHPIRAGDVIACPPGGPETAHQVRNTGETPLKVLSVSTTLLPEVVEYPDSGKFGVRADFGTDAEGKPRMFRFNGRVDAGLDYWDGED